MKDQRKLLNVCIEGKIPAFVLQGNDACSVEILKSANEIYLRNGCSEEFQYDFQSLVDNFLAYQDENQSEIQLPNLKELEMGGIEKKNLLNYCLNNDIPVIVFQGTDACSVEILRAANEIYEKSGCREELQYDFQNLIDGFRGYQYENQLSIKLPELNQVEKQLVREDINNTHLSAFRTAVEAALISDFQPFLDLRKQNFHFSEIDIGILKERLNTEAKVAIGCLFQIDIESAKPLKIAESGNKSINQISLNI